MTYEELKYAYMKKVQRVHELEDAVESYKMAEEQNKRYREALEEIRALYPLRNLGYQVFEIRKIVIKALEGEE